MIGRGWRAEGLGVLLLIILGWLVALPLVFVGVEAIRDGSHWTVEAFRRFFTADNEWRALLATVLLSLGTVVGAALLGVPLGIAVARRRWPGGRLLAALLAVPAVLPPLVGVLGFLFLYGETGFAAHLVQAVFGLEEAPWRLSGAGAVLLVHVSTMYVYFYLFTRAAMARIDGAVYEAAASLGAGPWRTLIRVVLPLLRSALGGAALLVFMTSLASFSAPYLFGGSFRVMTTQIVATKLNGDDRLAMVETLSLTLLAVLALLALQMLEGQGRGRSSGKGVPPVPRPVTGRWGRLASVGMWGAAVVLVLPAATLVLVSLVPNGTWTIETLPPKYSLSNYVTLLSDPVRLGPTLTSGWMAVVATAGAVLLGVGVAWLAVRHRVRTGPVLTGLIGLPWAVPGTVFAIALATAFSVQAPWIGRFLLVGTSVILPMAYLVRNLPIVGRAVLAGVRQLDPSLEEAGATLGAGSWRVFRRITFPLLRPALMAGAALAFVTAFGDFVTSIILYTYDTRPISLEILASLRQSDVGVAAAYGVILMAASAGVFFLAGQRQGPAG